MVMGMLYNVMTRSFKRIWDELKFSTHSQTLEEFKFSAHTQTLEEEKRKTLNRSASSTKYQ